MILLCSTPSVFMHYKVFLEDKIRIETGRNTTIANICTFPLNAKQNMHNILPKAQKLSFGLIDGLILGLHSSTVDGYLVVVWKSRFILLI